MRNAGQGGGCGDSFGNQIFCMRHLLGDDVDFTIYTWTYFEAGQPQQNINNAHEAFIRWSLLMVGVSAVSVPVYIYIVLSVPVYIYIVYFILCVCSVGSVYMPRVLYHVSFVWGYWYWWDFLDSWNIKCLTLDATLDANAPLIDCDYSLAAKVNKETNSLVYKAQHGVDLTLALHSKRTDANLNSDNRISLQNCENVDCVNEYLRISHFCIKT